MRTKHGVPLQSWCWDRARACSSISLQNPGSSCRATSTSNNWSLYLWCLNKVCVLTRAHIHQNIMLNAPSKLTDLKYELNLKQVEPKSKDKVLHITAGSQRFILAPCCACLRQLFTYKDSSSIQQLLLTFTLLQITITSAMLMHTHHSFVCMASA